MLSQNNARVIGEKRLRLELGLEETQESSYVYMVHFQMVI
ncbi:hypothetical protein AXFE_23340 [Acidithrix ferrooxidans]|uniref:Uncharacterized protein n=1 Tax=Acidithrix ferrooxidans TaxID=1280514 RepID=A0A0D8HG05_9ACTN|nr:hypothetical protein AXFE_23340 [Acidithrix ferrooxidans]